MLFLPYFLIHFLGGGATIDPSGPVPPVAAGGPALLFDVWPPGGPWPPRPPFCGPLWYPPAPLPRCAAGNCPDSHRGGGTGLDVGLFGFGNFGAAWVGMMDSSRAKIQIATKVTTKYARLTLKNLGMATRMSIFRLKFQSQ